MRSVSTGTLAGAGSFHCEKCGFAVALQERDEVPICPNCRGGRFKRASIFGRPGAARPESVQVSEHPGWLDDTRASLPEPGDYLAYEGDDGVQLAPLADGWTRVGRSLAAQLRFDDPTVSRRHALVHRDGSRVRVLDDRSLNGLLVNGERVDWREISDGDELMIGRFRLYFLRAPAQPA